MSVWDWAVLVVLVQLSVCVILLARWAKIERGYSLDQRCIVNDLIQIKASRVELDRLREALAGAESKYTPVIYSTSVSHPTTASNPPRTYPPYPTITNRGNK